MDQSQRQLKEDLQVLRIDRQRVAERRWRLPRWAVIVGTVVVVFAVIGLGVGRLDLKRRLGLGARTVRVALASRRGAGGPAPVLSASGYVIARNQVEVGSKITGRVVALFVDEGDFVRRGQIIARLDDRELRAQVHQARANLEAARARLAELEAGSRPQEIERAKAQMDRARADLRNAEIALGRTERLVREGVLQQQALDDARARYEMALNAYEAAKKDYELARIGPRKEAIELARAQVHQAEAALAFAQAQLDNTIIRAPITGTVLDRYVDVGEMVTTGFTSDRGAKQALVTIADLSDLQVELDITEADIAKVQLDQPVVITPDAYPNRHYRGVVEYIASVADRQKATIKVKVKVLNPDEFLRPDMGAKVTFYEKGAKVVPRAATVMVPRAAVVTRNGRPVVFLVQGEKAVMQPVTTGREEAGYVEILDGLQGGERVIVSGQEALRDGDRVVIREGDA
ncbi:MAG: efflux RND transporter periplasmic adaptor subunit [Acidobacteria bacterium]|nr:MAG: efflux RND transporter periplasmic adaptor subunit [Acidobacteriota bacterium]